MKTGKAGGKARERFSSRVAPWRLIFLQLVITFILIVASACTGGRPSESAGEQAIRSVIDQGREERLGLKSFTKTDGIETETHYQMMFRAEAEFVSDALFTVGAPLISEGSSIQTAEFKEESKSFDWNDWFSMSAGFHPARKGDRLHLMGEILFEKRESGWTPIRLEFKFVQDSSSRPSG